MVKDEHIAIFKNEEEKYEILVVEGHENVEPGKQRLSVLERCGTFETFEEAKVYAKQKKKEVGFSKIYVYGDI
jgi:hypothetical protein